MPSGEGQTLLDNPHSPKHATQPLPHTTCPLLLEQDAEWGEESEPGAEGTRAFSARASRPFAEEGVDEQGVRASRAFCNALDFEDEEARERERNPISY